MTMNDIAFRLYSDIGMGPDDFRIILLLIYSFMMVHLLVVVLRFYAKAHKTLVASDEPTMTEDEFVKISKWPITIFVCWLLLAFCGAYLMVETMQWPSSHGHYVGTSTKSHSSDRGHSS
ncbi:hypothetical protein GGI1_12355 [Acidithiobacillus sp. GGI-221]|nr:hypothetical protein GGI1_12355 [Acidithiobacillus sp. GGI-221]